MADKLPDIGDSCHVFDTYGKCMYGITCRFGKSHISEDGKNIVNEELFAKTQLEKRVDNILEKDVQVKLWKKRYDFSEANNYSAKIKKGEMLIDYSKNPVNSVETNSFDQNSTESKKLSEVSDNEKADVDQSSESGTDKNMEGQSSDSVEKNEKHLINTNGANSVTQVDSVLNNNDKNDGKPSSETKVDKKGDNISSSEIKVDNKGDNKDSTSSWEVKSNRPSKWIQDRVAGTERCSSDMEGIRLRLQERKLVINLAFEVSLHEFITII